MSDEANLSSVIDDLLIEKRSMGLRDYSLAVSRLYVAAATVEKSNTLTQFIGDIELNLKGVYEELKNSEKTENTDSLDRYFKAFSKAIFESYGDMLSDITDEQHLITSNMDFAELMAFEELCGE